MSNKPELDQVAEARRRLATHAQFPLSYWIAYGAALVVIMAIPVWTSLLPGASGYVSWGLLALALGFAAYSVIRRRRTGVQLPRRVDAYPSARRLHLGVLAVTLVGVVAEYALVANSQLVPALVLLLPLAALVFAGQYRIRAKMSEDIAAGRVDR